MKQVLFSTLVFLATGTAFGTVRNVSNSPNAPVNTPYTYDNLPDAITAASDGDTIYLHGTNVSYGNVTITNKELVIIGAGFGNNLQNSNNLATMVGTITFTDYTGTKNVSLIGLRMEEPKCGSVATNKVNVLYIERCGMRPVPAGSNMLRCNTLFFKQSVFGDHATTHSFSPDVASVAYISNSVIQGNFDGNNVSSAIFENNIFKRLNSGYSAGVSGFNGTAVFSNNIFMSDYQINVSNCTFNHNLFQNTASLGSGNTNTNNLFNTAPQLINGASSTTTIARGAFSTAVDYRPANGSPCIGAGTGGTDIGIYGGTSPIPQTSLINGVPILPRITQMTIQNMSVAPGGNLNVQIQAVNQE